MWEEKWKTVSKKGHGFKDQKRSWNSCPATVLVGKFSLKVVILYKLACYLISSALKSSLRRFLYSSGERRKGVSRLLALEYFVSPARLNSNKVWECRVVLDSINLLNSWAGPGPCLSHVWKSSFFPGSLFFCWLQISCCQFLGAAVVCKACPLNFCLCNTRV